MLKMVKICMESGARTQQRLLSEAGLQPCVFIHVNKQLRHVYCYSSMHSALLGNNHSSVWKLFLLGGKWTPHFPYCSVIPEKNAVFSFKKSAQYLQDGVLRVQQLMWGGSQSEQNILHRQQGTQTHKERQIWERITGLMCHLQADWQTD